MYRLWLATARTSPFGDKQDLAVFKTNLAGAQVVQTVGPFRQVLTIRARKDCRADATTILAGNAGRERRCRACPENTVTMSGVLEVSRKRCGRRLNRGANKKEHNRFDGANEFERRRQRFCRNEGDLGVDRKG